IDGALATDGAGALRRVEGLRQVAVLDESLRRLLAGLFEQVLAIEEQHDVAGGRHRPLMALETAFLADGRSEVVEVEFLLVLRPQVIERHDPAVLGKCQKSAVIGIDDVGRAGLGGEGDRCQLQRLVKGHELRVHLHARDRGAYFPGDVLDGREAMADQLHRRGCARLADERHRKAGGGTGHQKTPADLLWHSLPPWWVMTRGPDLRGPCWAGV